MALSKGRYPIRPIPDHHLIIATHTTCVYVAQHRCLIIVDMLWSKSNLTKCQWSTPFAWLPP